MTIVERRENENLNKGLSCRAGTEQMGTKSKDTQSLELMGIGVKQSKD